MAKGFTKEAAFRMRAERESFDDLVGKHEPPSLMPLDRKPPVLLGNPLKDANKRFQIE